MEIEVRQLTKTFGALRANDAVSLRFPAGRVHGVLGENGAGKSTLMKLLSGYLRADGGAILLDGRTVRLASPADALREGVGMIHQDPLDVPAFTALENFYLGSPPATMPDTAAARRLLDKVSGDLGFAVPPDAPLAALTVGQRQQLELMRLLVCGARALILDEPTTGITAAQAAALFAAVRRLAAGGTTVLFVSHKLEEVAELCDTVSVLRAGRVVGEQMPMPQPQDRLLALMFGQTGEAGSRLQSPGPRSGAQPTVWQLKDIVARDGNLELRVPALTIPRGASYGLAGLEGSGQQILLRLLAGRLRPLGGSIALGSAMLAGATAETFRRGGVQYLPADRLEEGVVGALSLADHFALQASAPTRGHEATRPRGPEAPPEHGQRRPHMSQAQQPAAAARARGSVLGRLLVDHQAAREQAESAIAAYAIRGTPDTPLASLSGGNQQRAMLSLLPPHLAGLLMEQPTRGLDVASARSVWQKLLDRTAAGTALVFASADLDELLEYSDYILVFFGGRMSPPIPRSDLSYERLAEMIGGVGFDAELRPEARE